MPIPLVVLSQVQIDYEHLLECQLTWGISMYGAEVCEVK